MSPRKTAVISLVIASVLWAASGTLAKLLLPFIDPMPLFMMRVGVATAILLPIYFSRRQPPVVQTLKDTWPTLLAAFGNFFFFILGVSRTTANAAAIIYTITPLLTLLLAKAKIRELHTPRKLTGVVLGLLGVLFILLLPVFEGKQIINGDPVGNLLILAAVLSWTYYIVSSRQLITEKHYEPMTITTYFMVLSFILFSVLVLMTPHRPFISAAMTGIYPWLILLYGAGITAVTFLLHQWAIKHSSAITASLTNYLQPLFAFGYNATFIGEKLSLEFMIGSVLVLVGTFLATSEQASAYMKSATGRQ